MPKTRTGARTYLFVIQHACKLSHTAGFVDGLRTIMGSEDADTLYSLWTPFCSLLEGFISADDWWNKRDQTTPNLSGGEDTVGI